MPALEPGASAPNIKSGQFDLERERAKRPVILAFFKVSCPTCQYALPFLERLHQAYGSSGPEIVGVSQNSESDTNAFTKQYRISFPMVLDDKHSYPASNAYGLTNVPSIFYVSPEGKVEHTSVGWVKSEFEELNRKMAQVAKTKPAEVFKPGESVADFKAG